MAKLDFPAFEQHLAAFDFPRLFADVLGWNHASKPRPFAELLAAKNRKLDTYRHCAGQLGQQLSLRALRDDIDMEMRDANAVMNELLRDQFEKLQVKFEEAQWDAGKKDLGKPKKRPIESISLHTSFPENP